MRSLGEEERGLGVKWNVNWGGCGGLELIAGLVGSLINACVLECVGIVSNKSCTDNTARIICGLGCSMKGIIMQRANRWKKH